MNEGTRGTNIKYAPHAFTESGIYMLMTVLKGELAIRQSVALIRAFRAMKDYIIENQDLIGRHEFTQLKIVVSENRDLELCSRARLNEIDEQIKAVVDRMSDVVMRSEISPFLLDLGKPKDKHEFLILNGEPAKANKTYIDLYVVKFLLTSSVFLATDVPLKKSFPHLYTPAYVPTNSPW